MPLWSSITPCKKLLIVFNSVVNLESAILTYVGLGVILVIGFAILSRTNISLAALFRRRRKQVIEVEDDDDDLGLPEDIVVEEQVVMWNDIQVHDKADEFIKISGTTDGTANYYIICGVGPFRGFGVIQASAAKEMRNADEGSKTIVNMKGGDHAVVRFSAETGMDIELNQRQKYDEDIFKADLEAFMIIENHLSLVEGNSVKFYYKNYEAKINFIKPWEIPGTYASYSENSNFANLASFSNSANISRFVKEIVSASILEQTAGGSLAGTGGQAAVVSEMMDGTFYVMGGECPDKINIPCHSKMAVRFITGEEVGSGMGKDQERGSLEGIKELIQNSPAAHMKIDLAPEKYPRVRFRHENAEEDSAVNLTENNMVVSIPRDGGLQQEVIRITDLGSKEGEHVLEVTLNNMRGPVCPYVALWKY